MQRLRPSVLCARSVTSHSTLCRHCLARVAAVSSLAVLSAQREEWRDAWLAGEAGEAEAVAEEALEAPGAWDPAPAAWLMDADDDAVFGDASGPNGAHATRPAWQVRSSTNPHRSAEHMPCRKVRSATLLSGPLCTRPRQPAGSELRRNPTTDSMYPASHDKTKTVALQSEFRPPACAETVLAFAESLARRATWLSSADQRDDFLSAVPKVLALRICWASTLASILCDPNAMMHGC